MSALFREYEDRCEREAQNDDALTEEAAELAAGNLWLRVNAGDLKDAFIDWIAERDERADSTEDDFVDYQRANDTRLWRDAFDEAFEELTSEENYV